MSNTNERRSREQLRRELAETLNALEYKLDLPARAADWGARQRAEFVRVRKENPQRAVALLLGACVVVAVTVAGITAGASALIGRRR